MKQWEQPSTNMWNGWEPWAVVRTGFFFSLKGGRVEVIKDITWSVRLGSKERTMTKHRRCKLRMIDQDSYSFAVSIPRHGEIHKKQRMDKTCTHQVERNESEESYCIGKYWKWMEKDTIGNKERTLQERNWSHGQWPKQKWQIGRDHVEWRKKSWSWHGQVIWMEQEATQQYSLLNFLLLYIKWSFCKWKDQEWFLRVCTTVEEGDKGF